jgi:hypothetical protein
LPSLLAVSCNWVRPLLKDIVSVRSGLKDYNFKDFPEAETFLNAAAPNGLLEQRLNSPEMLNCFNR